MILPEHVHLAIEAVDMRWGADRLSLWVEHSLGKSPCDGTVYIFSNRRRTVSAQPPHLPPPKNLMHTTVFHEAIHEQQNTNLPNILAPAP